MNNDKFSYTYSAPTQEERREIEDIRRAWEALGTLSGETASEAIVTEIFEKFCVGK